MTPAEAYFRSAPDDVFPAVDEVARGGMLIDAVRYGWRERVRCWGCDRMVEFNGRDLCAKFEPFLMRPRIEWAQALRCSGCGSKRLQVYELNDAAAHGEFMGPAHLSRATALLRLKVRLAEIGVALTDVLLRLGNLPPAEELTAVGLDDEAALLGTATGRT